MPRTRSTASPRWPPPCVFLPERDPHPALFDAVIHLSEALPDAESVGPLFVEFELRLLAELGFGLDLDSCAATGTQENLVYVSPRTGRAVSAQAGSAIS